MNSLEYLNEARKCNSDNKNPVFGGCRMPPTDNEGFEAAAKAACAFFHVTDSPYNNTQELNLCNMYVDNQSGFNNKNR